MIIEPSHDALILAAVKTELTKLAATWRFIAGPCDPSEAYWRSVHATQLDKVLADALAVVSGKQRTGICKHSGQFHYFLEWTGLNDKEVREFGVRFERDPLQLSQLPSPNAYVWTSVSDEPDDGSNPCGISVGDFIHKIPSIGLPCFGVIRAQDFEDVFRRSYSA
jgi:hypothetical protein